MKQIIRSKSFIKSYQKRIKPNSKLVEQTKERINLFLEDKNNPMLKDHKLKGSKFGFRSFSVAGDIRIIYKEDKEVYIFVDIGSHNQVY